MVKIDSGDIRVERLPKDECQYWCEKGRVTHSVRFDVTPNGETVTIATGCAECMATYARVARRAAGSGRMTSADDTLQPLSAEEK